MMNLEILFFAGAAAGDSELTDIAMTHGYTTIAHHARMDGSMYHLVDFDPATGEVAGKFTVQGLDVESAWARGQSWGLYGFTMAYRESGDVAFLNQAVAMADFIVNHPDVPADHVLYFDFDVLGFEGVTPHRDASATAIATSALLELHRYVAEPRRSRYRGFALAALSSLSSVDYAAATGMNHHFLLMHGVGSYPAGSEIDVALSYADYYYLEALLRCSRL
jgi:hypothetical protein